MMLRTTARFLAYEERRRAASALYCRRHLRFVTGHHAAHCCWLRLACSALGEA
jgi:hypothetical protein